MCGPTRVLWAAGLVLGAALNASAAQIDRLEVERDAGAYHVRMTARLEAAPERVWRVLTDFARLADLSPAFREVEALPAPAPDLERVRTVTRFCVLVFCRSNEQVQDFRRSGRWILVAVVDPELSDLRQGDARWRLEAQDGGTRMHFTSRFTPDFWVPPVIGPWAIRRALAREAETVSAALERLAGGGDP